MLYWAKDEDKNILRIRHSWCPSGHSRQIKTHEDILLDLCWNAEKGFIWVLSTCVLMIPDYNFKLIR